METKQESSNNLPQEVEMAVREQAKFVVEYLQVVAEINSRNFLEAFQGKSDIRGIGSSGRLFSDAKIYNPPVEENTNESATKEKPKEKNSPPPPPSSEQIIQEGMDRFFENKEFGEYTLQRLATVQAVMDEKSKIFAKSFIEDFFKLIEQTPEWQRFYQDRKKEFSDTELEFLVDKIKGAFAYKLMSTAMKGNRDLPKEILLQTFFVNYPDISAPLNAYKQKTINEITLYKQKIEEDVKLLAGSSSKEVKKGHERTLLEDIKKLRANFDVTLQKSHFTSLGNKERSELLFDEIATILVGIATELNKIENENFLKECQVELAKTILHIYSHHSPRSKPAESDKKEYGKKELGKIELAELDWSNPQKLSMIRLANFVVQQHLREHVSAQYPDVLPLFDEKVELDKQRRLEKYQTKTTFFNDGSTEKNDKPTLTPSEEEINTQSSEYK
ncbi:hypothetical protein ACQUW5_05895 [Legionella sp. CNM-1927-20]|uniref:hypothetical protein n=1 Tax=Legionella sp. CNM-1927-20 TaxID=3422221 RepID=UPI00403B00AC